MIIRSVPRPHICLSCQRSLARRSTSSKLPFASRYASTATSKSTPDEPPSTEPDHKPIPLRLVGIETPDEKLYYEKYLAAAKPLSRRPLGKLHGHGGSRYMENQEALDASNLGDPAKVIVLRESPYNFHKAEHYTPFEEPEHVDIGSQLASEIGLVGKGEAEANLQTLKPKEGQEPETWEELNQLVRVIQDGFTYSQLVKYVETFKTTLPARDKEFLPPAADSLVLGVTPWRPGISSISSHFDTSPLRGYSMESHTAKQKLIMRILRQFWNLQLPEVEDGIGQFDIKVRDGDLFLLSNGRSSRLAMLHGQYLAEEHEMLQVFPGRGVIRVTTFQHKRDVALQVVNNELNAIQRETINLRSIYLPTGRGKGQGFTEWLEQNFNDETLVELGRLTNTDIVRSSADTLRVSCFEVIKSRHISSRIDIVKRLLVTSSGAQSRVRTKFLCDGLLDAPGAFVPYPFVEGLTWREKLRSWTRWTSPIAKDEKVIAKPQPSEDAIELASSSLEDETDIRTTVDTSEEPTQVTKSTSTWDNRTLWDKKPWSARSAIFGSVLHCADSPAPKNLSDTTNNLSLFSTHMPTISRILRDGGPVVDKFKGQTPLKYLTMRLLPSPFQSSSSNIESKRIGAVVAEAFPPIEIIFSVGEDNDIEVKDVFAIISEINTDVMRPLNTVDVRWQTRTTRRLKQYYKSIPGIKKFIQKSNLDLEKSIIETPPSLKIPIQKILCNGQGLALLEGDNANVKQVEYLFAGLEIKKVVRFEYRGWKLLYTTIEAGRAGGRRAELRLRPSHCDGVSNKSDFVKAVFDFAAELGDDAPSNSLPLLEKLEPKAYTMVDKAKPEGWETWAHLEKAQGGDAGFLRDGLWETPEEVEGSAELEQGSIQEEKQSSGELTMDESGDSDATEK